MTPRWNASNSCSHANENVCPTCDFDRYYATKYPDSCPWAESISTESDTP